MASYDGNITVNADPHQVWQLVSQVDSFQRYFPHAQFRPAEQDDQVLLEWTAGGQRVEEQLWFKDEPEQMRFEWGSAGPDNFHGYVGVHQLDQRHAEVDMHLEAPSVGERAVRQAVDQALSQIKQLSESDRR